MINAAVALVTMGTSWGVQTKHHLIPIMELAQALWVPHDAAFRQLFEFFQHFLPILHGVKAVHPKHDLDLHL